MNSVGVILKCPDWIKTKEDFRKWLEQICSPVPVIEEIVLQEE